MEVVGNYISLSRCQAECHRLEAKTKGHSVFDHAISSGNRFIFLGQKSHNDRVTAKCLKKGDFAVNLQTLSLDLTSLLDLVPNVPNETSLDETKLLAAVREQFEVYKNCYLSYLHGSKNLHISLVYGSIFVANAQPWVLGTTTVDTVEEALSKKIKPRNRNRNNRPLEMKFVDLQKAQDVASKLPLIGTTELVKKETFYIVEMKVSNNHKLKVVIDENYQFKSYQFEPFKWLDARLKSRRPAHSRGSDVDLRVMMSSRRDLETTEAYQSLHIFETFGKNQILSMENGVVEISKEYRRKATQVLNFDVDTYTLLYNDSLIFVEVNKVKKYDAKRPLRYPDKEYTSIKLFADSDVSIDSNVDIAPIEELVKNMLKVGNILKP